ncbi:MAG: phosphatidate cytidylyltransferase [Candidatus Abyssubacteria bacterium]
MSAESGSRKKRYISAAIGIPVGLAVCIFSPVLFNLLAVALIAVGVVEFYGMARHRGFSPHSVTGTAFTVVVCVLAWVGEPTSVLYALAASVLVVFTLAMARNARDAMANVAVTVLGIFYVGWFCSYIIALRELPLNNQAAFNFGGAGYVIMLLVLLWLNDSGAFFAGTGWGRHKLVPAISPNKTIEGSVGGIVLTIVGAMLEKEVAILLESFNVALFPALDYSTYVLIGLGVGIAGQIGDLCESYLKRDAGLKDSGNLLPGHGGFLDRFDSLIFTAPLFYFMVRFSYA